MKIQDGVITGSLSLPIDEFLPGGKGRFFNGSGVFDVSLAEGVLVVRLMDAMVNEQPIPPVMMSEIRKQNLANEIQKDAKVSRSISRFEAIEVKGDRLVLTLKRPVPKAAAEATNEVSADNPRSNEPTALQPGR